MASHGAVLSMCGDISSCPHPWFISSFPHTLLSRFDKSHGSFPHGTLKVLSSQMAYLKFPSLYSQGFIKPDGLSQVSITVLSRFYQARWLISSFHHCTLKVLSSQMAYLKFPSLYSQGFIKPGGLSQVSITVLSRFDKSHGSFPHGALTVS